MKAAVLREYGKLSVEEVPEIIPGDYDCLVQIVACGICNGTDSKLYHGQFPPHGQPPVDHRPRIRRPGHQGGPQGP